MCKQFLSAHLVYHIGQTIALHIQVRRVYLLNISCKYHLSAFARTCDNRFDFMRRQVLRFINNAKGIGKASTTDLSKRGCM